MVAVRRAALVGAGVAVVAAGAALVLAHRGPAPALAPTAAVSVHAGFDRSPVSFGDAVTARVVVRLDRRAVDAARLSIRADLSPLERLGASRSRTFARGNLAVVEYVIRAACLSDRCLQATGARRLRVPEVRVEVPRRARGVASAVAAWPVLLVAGRVTTADVVRLSPPFRFELQPPAPHYPIDPTTLGRLLEAAAAVLAAAGAGLLGWQVALLARARRRRTGAPSELEVALELVREAQKRPPADRRRALGSLAPLLDPRDERLAGATRRLAWSRPTPVPDELSELVAEVDRRVEP